MFMLLLVALQQFWDPVVPLVILVWVFTLSQCKQHVLCYVSGGRYHFEISVYVCVLLPSVFLVVMTQVCCTQQTAADVAFFHLLLWNSYGMLLGHHYINISFVFVILNTEMWFSQLMFMTNWYEVTINHQIIHTYPALMRLNGINSSTISCGHNFNAWNAFLYKFYTGGRFSE